MTQFARSAPESVGLRSRDILELIDRLEASGTEMHGLMILRGDTVAAEGWWAPFAPGMRHGLQSHTKTYAATGVGIAYSEGLLRLDEKIIDIFPEYAPEEPGENLRLLTVRDVLCMGCGMEAVPGRSAEWIRDFLATPVVHRPGTAFQYNSMASTLLCAIVERKTGRDFCGYLAEKLFRVIGIREENVRWLFMPDGTPMGGSGMFSTTEDNLRLMKLYMNGGVWNGRRVLAQDYVEMATRLQNDSASEAAVNPRAVDNHVGYGFQIWMCRPRGVYRADGAMGQFTICVPDLDMIIAINETAGTPEGGIHWAQNTLNLCWEYLERVRDAGRGEGSAEDAEKLQRRLRTLSLPRPAWQPESPLRGEISGKRFRRRSGNLDIRIHRYEGPEAERQTETLALRFDSTGCFLDMEDPEGRTEIVRIATDGSRFSNLIGGDGEATRLVLGDGAWEKDNRFTVHLRWAETCFVKTLVFTFEGGKCRVREPESGDYFRPYRTDALYESEA